MRNYNIGEANQRKNFSKFSLKKGFYAQKANKILLTNPLIKSVFQ